MDRQEDNMEAEQYMKALNWELRRLPKEEREEAISYYREYFEEAAEAAENGEYDPVQEFGEPKFLAQRIIQECMGKLLDETPKTTKKSMLAVWMVILAIFASPIALPLGLMMITLMLCLVIMVVAVIGSLFVGGAAILFAGIIGVAISVRVLFASPATGLASLGSCLILIGIGGIMATLFYYLGKLLVMGIARLFGRKIKKRKEEVSNE